jgi:hypothetical protein
LPDIWRIPLLLSVVGGFSSAEIAHLLYLKEVAIRQRPARARKRFRQLSAIESGKAVIGMTCAPQHRSMFTGTTAKRLTSPLR